MNRRTATACETPCTLREQSARDHRSFDPAAAENAVAVVTDGGLAGGDGMARLVETDVEPPARQQFHRGFRRPAAVADLDLGAEGGERGERRGESGEAEELGTELAEIRQSCGLPTSDLPLPTSLHPCSPLPLYPSPLSSTSQFASAA